MITKKRARSAALTLAAIAAFTFAGAGAAQGSPAIPLNGGQEAPAPNAFGAHGSFSYEIDGTEFCYTLEVSGLSAPATAAHVHVAPRNVPGPVVIHAGRARADELRGLGVHDRRRDAPGRHRREPRCLLRQRAQREQPAGRDPRAAEVAGASRSVPERVGGATRSAAARSSRTPAIGYGASRKIAGQPLCAYTMTENTIASNSRCTTSTYVSDFVSLNV